MQFHVWLAAGFPVLALLLIVGLATRMDRTLIGPIATSTPSVTLSTSTPRIEIATTSPHVATARPETPQMPAQSESETGPVAPPPFTASTATPVSSPALPNQIALDAASAKARAALVNILCFSENTIINSVTGSGVIIDPKGIIVTNAHIAQYFLLVHSAPLGVSCVIRTGSPARLAYEADLIFVSPQWIARNAATFSEKNPAVNGDYDYAFLAITASITDDPLPASFPFVPLGMEGAYVDEPVVIAAYAAEFLVDSQISSSLFPTIVFGSVKSLSAFVENNIDLIELGGSAAAQHGSSGGGVVNAAGVFEGLIAIGTNEEETKDRDFSALTASYLRRVYKQEEGRSLDVFLEQNPLQSIAAFAWRVPNLADPVIRNLNPSNTSTWWL